MKHFAEARGDAAQVAGQLVSESIVGICLIWDVRGRLRVLARVEKADAAAVRTRVEKAMQAAADVFWSGDVWIWDQHARGAALAVYERAWRESRPLGDPAADALRELDRHLSKGAWFGAPLQAPWPLNAHTPPIVSFYSFKGGVGRTTALVSFALQLSLAGRRVCVIDLDLEAPGAGTLLAPGGVPSALGVVDYLIEAPLIEKEMPSLGEYVQEFHGPDLLADKPPIAVMPAGAVDDRYLEKLARIDYEHLLVPIHDEPSTLVRLVNDLRQVLDPPPEYVLIDARAGLHDVGGLALNGLAHLDVVFALDNAQSWAGLRTVVRHVGETGKTRTEPQPCALVQAMALPRGDPDWEQRRAQFTETAYDLFTEVGYYGDEPPAADNDEAAHYPFSLGFDENLQRARSLDDMLRTQRLFEGDHRSLCGWILQRLGRKTP
jgi:cellulose biosynthesis protein BcsQ